MNDSNQFSWQNFWFISVFLEANYSHGLVTDKILDSDCSQGHMWPDVEANGKLLIFSQNTFLRIRPFTSPYCFYESYSWDGWDGMGMTMAQWCITPCSKVYSLASTFARSSKALRSSKVIPANNPFHSCKYSTGTSRTIWYGCYCYCQFKEGIQTYNIRLVCTVITYIQYL